MEMNSEIIETPDRCYCSSNNECDYCVKTIVGYCADCQKDLNAEEYHYSHECEEEEEQ